MTRGDPTEEDRERGGNTEGGVYLSYAFLTTALFIVLCFFVLSCRPSSVVSFSTFFQPTHRERMMVEFWVQIDLATIRYTRGSGVIAF